MNPEESRKMTSQAEELLLQIHQFLEEIKSHQDSIHITPEIEQQIKEMREIIDTMQQMDEEGIGKLGMTPQEFLAESLQNPNFSIKLKQTLQLSKSIGKDARRMRLAYARAIKEIKDQSKGTQKTKRTRRKLFKPLGGEKNWIPL